MICKLSRLNTNTGLPLAAVHGKEGILGLGGGEGWKGGDTFHAHLSILIYTSNKISCLGC